MNSRRIIGAALLVFVSLLAVSPFVIRASLRNRYDRQIYDLDKAPVKGAALVFGAAVNRDGWLSTVLRDRMDTAIGLYQSGAVKHIVVSGHQDESTYDEPGSMRAYAVAKGVPESAITMDTRGDRTYDTCYWAQHEFHLDSVLLVTQEYHLPRALFTCYNLGIDADGVRADMRTYRSASWYELRETVATLVAIADLLRGEPPLDDALTVSQNFGN
ncbi:MAG TPA: ElyC/SanA/YdcF family protein [candidate division Zixibacteria bacterium]|nr:ElyC/SanA/YdcF family protein [candidate division Zixibacteria bacterium]